MHCLLFLQGLLLLSSLVFQLLFLCFYILLLQVVEPLQTMILCIPLSFVPHILVHLEMLLQSLLLTLLSFLLIQIYDEMVKMLDLHLLVKIFLLITLHIHLMLYCVVITLQLLILMLFLK